MTKQYVSADKENKLLTMNERKKWRERGTARIRKQTMHVVGAEEVGLGRHLNEQEQNVDDRGRGEFELTGAGPERNHRDEDNAAHQHNEIPATEESKMRESVRARERESKKATRRPEEEVFFVDLEPEFQAKHT
jgi:hypothetical protein